MTGWRLYAAAAGLLCALLAAAAILTTMAADARRAGAAAERAAIERANRDAGDKAETARDAYDGCAGGLFDFAKGTCRR